MYTNYFIISCDVVIYKKYVLVTYIQSSPKVPGLQLPKPLEFPELLEQWEHILS